MVCFLVLAISSCATPSVPLSNPIDPTLTLMVDTPQPSITPTSLPTETPTPFPTIDRTGTEDAYATAEMAAKLRPIAPKLEKLGFTLDSGLLVYSNPSMVAVSVDSYMADDHKLILEKPIQDFILQADIGWNSTSGLAGCGIMFRAEDDLERGANYQYLMMRLSGAPGWDIQHYRYAQYQYSLVPETQFTQAIDNRQNAVNTVTLIVRGDTIESYMNTTKGIDAKDNALTEGGIGLLAWQESGKTTCTFSNVWIWKLNNPFPNGSSGGAEAYGALILDEMIGFGLPANQDN